MSDPIRSRQSSADERQFYRNLLRAARYAALADAEGFDEICFAVESLLYESSFANGARLWLVTERDTLDNSDRLLGVLSPFERM